MSVTPMFPLEVAMLPGEELPLRIFEPRYAALVRDCLAADDPVFGVVLIEAGREVGGGDRRSRVGVLARIAECAATGEGRYRMNCPLGERIRVTEWLDDQPYPRAVVDRGPTSPTPASIRRASAMSRNASSRCSSGSRPPAAVHSATPTACWPAPNRISRSACTRWPPACRWVRPTGTRCWRHRARRRGLMR